jgi:hypothetical protein
MAAKARDCNAPHSAGRPLDSPTIMPSGADTLRTELGATATRLIAEEGCDYGQAKRRALHDLLGDRTSRGLLPDNSEIEHELRRHLLLFAADTHPALLAALRRTAAGVMAHLSDFSPHLVGAVLSGTATEHSDIELHLFTDSAKDVEVFLMDAGIEFEVEGGDGSERPLALERLTFVLPAREPGLPQALRHIGVRLHVYDRDAIRVAPRHRALATTEFDVHPIAAGGRANLAALRQLIEDSEP